MKRLFASADRLIVGHLAAALEDSHIPCVVRNQFLSGAVGELPVNEAWPEIWVMDERDLPKAKEVLQDLLGAGQRSSHWRCICGEQLESQFTQCWDCGASREE